MSESQGLENMEDRSSTTKWIWKSIDEIKSDISKILELLEKKYVSKEELEIVKLKYEYLKKQVDFLQGIIFGIIGTLLTLVLCGMVVFYINAPK